MFSKGTKKITDRCASHHPSTDTSVSMETIPHSGSDCQTCVTCPRVKLLSSVNRTVCPCRCADADVCSLSLFWLSPSVCSPPPPVACLSPPAAGESGEVTRLQSFSVVLKTLVLPTAAGLKSLFLYVPAQTVQTGFQTASVSNYQVLSEPAVAGRHAGAV